MVNSIRTGQRFEDLWLDNGLNCRPPADWALRDRRGIFLYGLAPLLHRDLVRKAPPLKDGLEINEAIRHCPDPQ